MSKGPSKLAWSALGLAALSSAITRFPRQNPPPAVDFARDVQPLLAASCVRCHGPGKSKADLRLDLRARAFAGAHGGTSAVIVPGNAAASPLYQRVASADELERMPLDEPALTREQIETLRAWIDQGAVWPDALAGDDERAREHWAWRAPVRPAIPEVRDAGWPRNPIDAFVLACLERDGLTPAPEADRATLLRRLSLDLNGLPPAPEETRAFVADPRSDAYELAVERLLSSPRYGERMASAWLDLARYADSHGYEKDARREMWRYRDWVIDAFNRNLHFDQFTVEQLAGDLLPDASVAQQTATGFHRNTMLNEEGGTDPEEFRVDAVLDRVNTTATVWLGATLGCAQCHDHKFDPFTQRDYYRMFAAFNGTADGGKDPAPVIDAPDDEQAREDQRLASETAEREKAFEGADAELDAAQATWERETLAHLPPPTEWRVLEPLEAESKPPVATLAIRADHSVLVTGPSPDKIEYRLEFQPPPLRFNVLRLEALADDSLPAGGPGRSDGGNFLLSTLEVALEGAPAPLAFVAAEGDIEQRQGRFRASEALDANAETGWGVGGVEGGVNREAVFVLADALELDGSKRVAVTLQHHSQYARHALGRMRIALAYDEALARRFREPELSPWRVAGTFHADSFESARDQTFAPEEEHARGVEHDGAPVVRADWIDRHVHALEGERCATYLERRITTPVARKLELFVGADDAARVWLNGALVHSVDDYASLATQHQRVEVALHAGENRLLLKVVNGGGEYGFFFDVGRKTDDVLSPRGERALRTAAEQRTPEESALLREFFRRNASERGRKLWLELEGVRARHKALAQAIASTYVMAELAMPRESRVLVRGSFLAPGEVVAPGVPQLFGELDTRGEPARLALARWLVSERNPLAARVTVNRLWEQLFGRGLVATSEDFGTRSDPPTHPQLLDWLACEFVARGWDVKALARAIVTSATYRQSSHASALSRERDPDNALCSRGARRRVEAETLRDVALAASGLLVERLGGPSVFPPQPAGIWNSAYSSDDWTNDDGENRWRRGLYTFWKRTAPYATFTLFEAPSREVACTRRARTNTPLQALALLDDPAFVEAHVALARRMLREAPVNDAARIARGFELCVSRAPSVDEVVRLRELVNAARSDFAAAPERARERVAAGPRDERDDLDTIEIAAWTSVACVLLNLDEAQSRP